MLDADSGIFNAVLATEAHAAALQPQEAVIVYLNIAHANAKKDTTVANTALGKALDLLPQTPTWDQLNTLPDI